MDNCDLTNHSQSLAVIEWDLKHCVLLVFLTHHLGDIMRYFPMMGSEGALVTMLNLSYLGLIIAAYRRKELPRKRYLFITNRALNDIGFAWANITFLLMIRFYPVHINNIFKLFELSVIISLFQQQASALAVTALFYLAVKHPLTFRMIRTNKCVYMLLLLKVFLVLAILFFLFLLNIIVEGVCNKNCTIAFGCLIAITLISMLCFEIFLHALTHRYLSIGGDDSLQHLNKRKLWLLRCQRIIANVCVAAILAMFVVEVVIFTGFLNNGVEADDLGCYISQNMTELMVLERCMATCFAFYMLRSLTDPLFELGMDPIIGRPLHKYIPALTSFVSLASIRSRRSTRSTSAN